MKEQQISKLKGVYLFYSCFSFLSSLFFVSLSILCIPASSGLASSTIHPLYLIRYLFYNITINIITKSQVTLIHFPCILISYFLLISSSLFYFNTFSNYSQFLFNPFNSYCIFPLDPKTPSSLSALLPLRTEEAYYFILVSNMPIFLQSNSIISLSSSLSFSRHLIFSFFSPFKTLYISSSNSFCTSFLFIRRFCTEVTDPFLLFSDLFVFYPSSFLNEYAFYSAYLLIVQFNSKLDIGFYLGCLLFILPVVLSSSNRYFLSLSSSFSFEFKFIFNLVLFKLYELFHPSFYNQMPVVQSHKISFFAHQLVEICFTYFFVIIVSCLSKQSIIPYCCFCKMLIRSEIYPQFISSSFFFPLQLIRLLLRISTLFCLNYYIYFVTYFNFLANFGSTKSQFFII